jgi:hypothetical protein
VVRKCSGLLLVSMMILPRALCTWGSCRQQAAGRSREGSTQEEIMFL